MAKKIRKEDEKEKEKGKVEEKAKNKLEKDKEKDKDKDKVEDKERKEIEEAKKVKKRKIEKKEKDKDKDKDNGKSEKEAKSKKKNETKEKGNEDGQKEMENGKEKEKENKKSMETDKTTIETENTENTEQKGQKKKKTPYQKKIDEITAINEMCNIAPISEPMLKTKHYRKFLKLMDYIYYTRVYANKILNDNTNLEEEEKKILKTKFLYIGISQVHKAINKNCKGILILAIDVFPIDIICHLPALCEEHHILYTYVTTKHALAKICKLKRSLTCFLISQPSEEIKQFEEICYKHNFIKIKNFKHLYEKFEQAIKSNHPFCSI